MVNFAQMLNAPLFIGNTTCHSCQPIYRRNYAVVQLALICEFGLLPLIFSFYYLGHKLTAKINQINYEAYTNTCCNDCLLIGCLLIAKFQKRSI